MANGGYGAFQNSPPMAMLRGNGDKKTAQRRGWNFALPNVPDQPDARREER